MPSSGSSKKVEKASQDFSQITPINTTPARYEIINIVHKFSDIKEDIPNILKVLPVKNSSILKISKSTPYTITAFLVEANGDVTNHQIALKFFAGKHSWWNKMFLLHNVITISGRPKFFKDKFTIIHPIKLGDAFAFARKSGNDSTIAIVPHYKKDIDDAKIQEHILHLLKANPYTETISQKINRHLKTRFNLNSALTEVHKPSSLSSLEEVRNFLASFEYISYKHTIQKINNHKATAIKFNNDSVSKLHKELHQSLKFRLTQGQIDAISEITKFQQSANGKLFLLQGDVGCGKTIVAISSAVTAVKAGFQVAVLAPTQILATQLFSAFSDALTPFEISCTLLVSKERVKEKRVKLDGIKMGAINVVIGTHAIFSEAVSFINLGFVIIDEQHKFGVRQRLELMKKSQNAKCLTMTATPIPRTLSMSMYSGVEYFSITEKPQNRLPIITTAISTGKANDLVTSTKKKFGKLLKMYWVCPLIDSESQTKANIKEREVFLKKHFTDDEVLTIHGQMKQEEITEKILQFKEDTNVKVLLATTIIEVGIDIPKANIIVIESAETFGLASLHQLRGRVGRSSEQGYCILLFNESTEGRQMSQQATERLQAMKDSNDGFHIAQVDRKIRGSGNILGDAQSGTMKFTFFDEELHQNLLLNFEGIFLNFSQEEKDEISNLFHASVNVEYSEG